ncbi:hypothetical protein [Curtobacterium sp. 9128]|uniref:hypothetical protein n=1 Tax=Curtobacterium sp. 9128 TaxID=1793722 RepID=UPI002481A857|nr:hypothetical protein [Curtobacterium sp. 9128]
MARASRALEVRADHGVLAAGWRLALAGVVRAVTPGRRLALFVSLGVVVVGLVVAVVVGLVRGSSSPASVAVLIGTAALLAYLVVAVELVVWTMADRRRVAPTDVDPERLGRVQQAIADGHASSVEPADRRALVRFARVQQTALPATVLVHVLGVSVGVLLAALEAFAGSAGIVVLVLAVLIVAVSAWSLRGALRALGSTPELVALED